MRKSPIFLSASLLFLLFCSVFLFNSIAFAPVAANASNLALNTVTPVDNYVPPLKPAELVPVPEVASEVSKTKPVAAVQAKKRQQPKVKVIETPALASAINEPTAGNCNVGSFASDFLCLINAHRRANNLNSLTYDSSLNAVAVVHSTWMNQVNLMSHVGKDNSKFYERCESLGTTCSAENIAKGYTSAIRLFEAWKVSPAHNANMLGHYKKTGLALVGIFATSLFR